MTSPSDTSTNSPRWYLTGATAAGKTQVSLELAKLLGAEILSMDSMAIYRQMDIGTAKPTRQDRAQVTHHLLDLVDPDEDFSLATYLDIAQRTAAEVAERGPVPLFGGTPLYLKGLLRGIFSGPPADWDFRRQVMDEVEQVGVEALHARLQQVDPVSAHKLHPQNVRRIVRALEVYKITGQPISHLQMEFEEGLPAESCRVFVLFWPRPEIHRRIEQRVDRMFELGLVDEVRALESQYQQLSRTAMQAVGYRECLDYLDGAISLEYAVSQVKTRTRRFARRQETWFRSLSECRFVPIAGEYDPRAIAEQILAMV